MAVVYGFFLAHLLPRVWGWYSLPSGFGPQDPVAQPLLLLCLFFGSGVVLSGIRDLAASSGIELFQKDLFMRD